MKKSNVTNLLKTRHVFKNMTFKFSLNDVRIVRTNILFEHFEQMFEMFEMFEISNWSNKSNNSESYSYSKLYKKAIIFYEWSRSIYVIIYVIQTLFIRLFFIIIYQLFFYFAALCISWHFHKTKFILRDSPAISKVHSTSVIIIRRT